MRSVAQPWSPTRVGDELLAALEKPFEELTAAVGFVNASGVRHVAERLRAAQERGSVVRILVGVDGTITSAPGLRALWRGGEEIDLTPVMPGKVEEVAARLIAVEPEYADLARLEDTPVLTIYLNEDYAPLKRYLGVRQRDLVRTASSPAYERYAVDVRVAMLVLHHAREARVKKGEQVDEAMLEVARHAAAQGAVSILPQFDELARHAGLEE